MDKMINFYKFLLSFVTNHFRNSTIIETVEYHYNGWVYNLSVEDDETYIADGFLVHNCRSTLVPVVKEEYRNNNVTGRRGAVSVDAAGNETRKQVSAQTTYGGWLKKQPASFQDEVLGDTRAKLFRSGGLTIDKFRDETGRTYTLEQLQQLEPMAFERANVEV